MLKVECDRCKKLSKVAPELYGVMRGRDILICPFCEYEWTPKPPREAPADYTPKACPHCKRYLDTFRGDLAHPVPPKE